MLRYNSNIRHLQLFCSFDYLGPVDKCGSRDEKNHPWQGVWVIGIPLYIKIIPPGFKC